MGFGTAVSSVLSNYAGFSGRARRSEYWWWQLFLFLVYLVAAIVDAALGLNSILLFVVVLALALPTIAVTVRRLHDTDRSGWWFLIALIPLVGPIVLLVFCVMDSTPGPNQYGPSPKHAF